MTSRRSFLRTLFVTPLVAAIVPWNASAAAGYTGLKYDDIVIVASQYLLPALQDSFFKSDPLIAYLRDRNADRQS